ncbi:MBG domain-containing protein [Blastomonas sp.]|uniref:MBG domain-containing protein n=1 Tax=Blastomonas sp. TaxID=1909299 RepID=UPI002633D9C0|nr:MBG domain-containing protein [Blastomonas sp.]MDM7955961.1 MBG domain-containing protein [Blastomonas sp.]
MSHLLTLRPRHRRSAGWRTALRTGVAGLAIVTAQTALANPGGGNVVAGNATINGQGTDRVRIDQTSDRVVINWDSFSIGAGQGVDFRQPGARSIALNRVTGPEISQIMGELTANGQVYLINGNGIVFGKDARVDVAGLVATSADIGNDAFMAGGSLRFGTPGRAGAKIINHSTITVRDAGIAAFVAPQVANDGIITAHMGRIAFGGAQAFTLDLHGDNLIRFQVGDAVTKLDDKGALVDIDGVVDARGGSLLITASAARDLVNQSVRIGTPQAASMQVGADGKVSLIAAKVTIAAPGEVQVGSNVAMDLSSGTNAVQTGGRPAKGGNNSNIGWVGSLDGDAAAAPGQALAASGTGGTLTISAARTILDGTINLDGSKAGGTAHITGSDFLSFGSILSASGADAGGKIQLDAGGFSLAGRITVNAGLGKGGNVDIHTTRRAIDTGDAFIDASGLHGGTIRYVSDDQIISSGRFRASGSHGFGGSIDVSAPRLDLFSAQFYAQGGVRGGRVRLGGEFQGGRGLSLDELPNARTLVATDAVTIDVSAIGMRGNAGEIVLWSDERTTFLGKAIALGGLVGGLGGQIEISGKETLVYRGTVETARDGQRGGKLLLDPKNIIIADVTNTPSQYGLVLQAFSASGPGAAPASIAAGDGFGSALSLDGNRLAVGIPGDDGADDGQPDAGAVYLFSFADSLFAAPVLSAVIGSGYSGGRNIALAGLEAGDLFGYALSLDGQRLAVSARNDDGEGNAATDAGAVYLFTFDDVTFGNGTLRGIVGAGYSGPANLSVANLEASDLFGASVSLDGDRLAVGALFDDGATNAASDAGAVYLFSFADSLFSNPLLEATIGEGYGGAKDIALALDANDYFGAGVSLSGSRLAVGAVFDDGEGNASFSTGAVYLFAFDSPAFESGTLQSRIGFGYSGSSDVDLNFLDPSDHFGQSVSLDGNRLSVVASLDDGGENSAPDSGAVRLFTLSDDPGLAPQLRATIGANYGNAFGDLTLAGYGAGDSIGAAALDGNRLVIGVANDDGQNDATTDAGAVYLFTFDEATFKGGRQVGTLGAGYRDFTGLSLAGEGLERFDGFGTSVALDGNRLAVGAPFDDGAGNSNPNAGAVYLFTFGDAQFSAPVLQSVIGSGYSGGKNLSVARLDASDMFGTSVSLDGLRLAVGAPGDDGLNNNSGDLDAGAVYLFTFGSTTFDAGALARVLNFETFTGGSISAQGAQFGSAVSLDGNFIAVGAAGDAGTDPVLPAFDAGAVHLFDLGSPDFSATPIRLSTIGKGYEGGSDADFADLSSGDRFGSAVALDGLRLAVGAPGDDGFMDDFFDPGAVFLFSFADTAYANATLDATIGAFYLGSDDFTPPGLNLSVPGGSRFGQSVSLQGRQLAVGAMGDAGASGFEGNSGAVFLFTFGGSGFSGITQTGQIGSGYAGAGDYSLKLRAIEAGFQLGSAVSLDNNRLVAGASNSSGPNDSAPGSGAAYLFTFGGAGFAEPRLIDTLGSGYEGQQNFSLSLPTSSGSFLGPQFGAAVALDGRRLAVGVPGDGGSAGSGVDLGAVYLFSFADLAFRSPMLEAIIGDGYAGGKNVSVPLDFGSRFGSALSLDGNRLAVGVPGDRGNGDPPGFDVGSVFLFTFSDAQFGGGALVGKIGTGYVGAQSIDMAGLEDFDNFGASVALRGNALVVGAPFDDGQGNGVFDSGAAYLFSFADAAFNGGQLEGYVAAGATGIKDIDVGQLDSGDLFGSAVALDQDGFRLFVGAPGDQGDGNGLSGAGAVYQFGFFSPGFGEGSLIGTIGAGYEGSLDLNIDGIGSAERFGSSLALDGSYLAVGAPGDNGAGDLREGTGAVYVFNDDEGGFSLNGLIGAGYTDFLDYAPGEMDNDDQFGSSVALSQNRLAIGAVGADGFADTSFNSGAVYLFSFDGGSLRDLALRGTIGTGYGAQKNLDLLGDPGDNIGVSVALLGNRLVIGVPGAPDVAGIGGDPGTTFGAAYLFTFADATFSAPTVTGIIGQGYTGAGNFDVAVLEDGDMFGASVALDGLRLAVGAPGDDGANDDTANAGAVYLFSFANTGFASPVLEARVGRDYSGFKNVSVGDLTLGDSFGASVSLRGTQLAVGVPGDDGQGNNVTNTGAAYLFTFTNSIFNGGERAGTIGDGYNILAGDFSLTLETGDQFGSAVSLGTLGLAVGASGDDGANNDADSAGAVYLFNFADTSFASISLASTLGRDYISGSNDLSILGVDAFDEFGGAVSLDGTTLAVGSRGDRGILEDGPNAGAVYLLNFGDTDFSAPLLWGIVGAGYSGTDSNLSITGLAPGDSFGSSVALDAGRLVVGAPGDDGVTADRFGIGKVYLFTFADTAFTGLSLAGSIGSGYANGLSSSLAANGIAFDERFGASVSLDGLRLAIGSPDDDGAAGLRPLSGAVYLLTFGDLAFGAPVLRSVIGAGYSGGSNLSVDSLGAFDLFGTSVSLDGTMLAVGAIGDDGIANEEFDAGAVYLFSFADAMFAAPSLQATIGQGYGAGIDLDPGNTSEDLFGHSVALDGLRLAVGAPGDDGVEGDVNEAGAVYLFSFAGPIPSAITSVGKIGFGYTQPGDIDMTMLGSGDVFGTSVALDGRGLAVGARLDDGGIAASVFDLGAVYTFAFADDQFGGGSLRSTIGFGYSGADDIDLSQLSSGDYFGTSVSLDGNRLVVGATRDNGAFNDTDGAGAVYAFSFADDQFTGPVLEATIGRDYSGGKNVGVDLGFFDDFGISVALDGNRLAVGAASDDGPGDAFFNIGAVHLFTFDDPAFTGGRLAGTIGAGYRSALGIDLTFPDGAQGPDGAFDAFGRSLSLDGNRLAVGAPGDDGALGAVANAGAVYLFTFADADFAAPVLEGVIGAGYSGGKNLSVGGLAADDLFGTAVSLDGNRLAVGAPFDGGEGDSALLSGAVYLFGFSDAAFSDPAQIARIGNGYLGGGDLNLALAAGAGFGTAVSLSGNRLAVGSPNDNGFGGDVAGSGAVYLFGFADDMFTGTALIGTMGAGYNGAGDVNLSAVLDAADRFGSSVALDGYRLAVGAALDGGFTNAAPQAGAVHLFTFASSDLTGGSLVGTIGEGYAGGNNLSLSGLAGFGASVALDGLSLAAGTFGSSIAYVFSFANPSFAAPGLDFRAGADVTGPNDIAVADTLDSDFGLGLSIDAGRLVVGAPRSNGPDGQAEASGAAYFFSLGESVLPGFGFGDDPGADVTISASALAAILSGGTGVELQANNDITVNAAILVDNPSGDGGFLTFRAGRSIFVNAGIVSDNGSVNLIANDLVANGVVDAFRDSGDAVITFGPGGFIDAGTGFVGVGISSGNDHTFFQSGAISLGSVTASAIEVLNAGMSGNAGVTLLPGAVLTASGPDYAIVVRSDVFTNLAGAGVFNLTGSGRFLVYSDDYDVIDRGGLTGNNLYNRNFVLAQPDTITQPGNLFIFSRQPILTFTADDATRTYGEATPAYGFQFSGLVNGESEAYAFSGAPNLFDFASGNAGTDTIFIDAGTLVSDVGYGFDFVTGALTTLRALLTARADDQTRQYGLDNPAFTVTYSGFVNGDDASVILSSPSFSTIADITSDVGSYTIDLGEAFADNYDFDYVPGTLTITKALLTVTADDASRPYGASDPLFTGSITGLLNSDTQSVISGLVYGSDALITSDAGLYSITGSGATATNYDFAYVPGTLTITKALLTVIADDATREYGLADPAFTGSISGFLNGDDDGVVSGLVYGSNAVLNSGIGSYAITGSGASATNYDFSYVPGTLTITRALLTVAADDASREYGLANPVFTGSITGLRAGDTASVVSGLVYGSAATAASDVGTFAITGSGGAAANYDFAYTPGTLTITRALLTVTANDATREYGLANPGFTGSVTGLRNGNTASVISGLVYGTPATAGSDVGSYVITGSGASATNYDFAYVPGTLTITKALLTVIADDATREYGLADPAFTGSISGFLNGDDDGVVSGLVYGSNAVLNSGIGSYAITGSGASATNYDFSYVPGTLTITRALLTVAADDASREYGLANPVFTGSITGLRAGDTASVVSGLVYGSAATAASDVGTFAITGSGGAAANYDFAYTPGTLTITRALLTVTANDATREYGLANPGFTGSVTGLRNGNTASVISGLVYGTPATAGSDVGSYVITGSGASATNYDFAYVPGTLTITRALLTISADSLAREYGLANPVLTSTIAGLRNGDTASVISGLVLATPATNASGVGNYSIGVSGGSALNYDFAYIPGTLAITPAPLTVTVDSKTRVYGSANPALTASITGFRNGDTDAVVSGLRLRTGAIVRTNVGDYVITGSGATAANYRFDYIPGTLTITKALLQVRVSNANREYGLDNPAFGAMITGFRNGDRADVVSGLTFGTVASIGSDVGSYAITASGASALNYDFAYTAGRLTIDRARLLITANSLVTEQGSGDPVLTVSYSGLRNGDTGDVVTGLVLRSSGGGSAASGQYVINASRGTARNYQITYRPGVMTVLAPIMPPTQDPPAANPPAANPPVIVPPPAGGGTTGDDPVAQPPGAGSDAAPSTPVPANPPPPVIALPGQGSVAMPETPNATSPLQVLQGLAAPLPVLLAPETRPLDSAQPGDPSRGGGQRTGCTYISLCSAAPVPLWTFQPAQ